VRTLTNPKDPEVNDHVNLQWLLYKQSQSSNLRTQKK
jgi:hypothetical protein